MTNNILAHPGHYIGDVSGASYPYVNILIKNAFYSSNGTLAKWYFNGSPNDNQTDYLADAGSAMSFSGNLDGINPYPSGPSGALNSQLVGIAQSISGITTIAADATGAALVEPLSLGYFPKWQA